MKIKSLFVSDLHLGSKDTHYKEFHNFIKSINRPDYLYLVGDIVDGWRLEKSWNWEDEYNFILRKFISWSKKGTVIVWIAGNHDEFLRNFINNFGNIIVCDEYIHETNGQKLLLIHGDKFDCLMRINPVLKKMGSMSYEKLIKVNKFIHRILKWFGYIPQWSFSAKVKSSLKSIGNYVGDFEKLLSNYARDKGCTGVVCGHIHIPKIRKIEDIDYYNCGDWQENTSFIIEDDLENMRLFKYNKETGKTEEII